MTGTSYIWGTGLLAQRVVSRGKTADFFIDNDPAKWGTSFCEKPVVKPDNICWEKASILIASVHFKEIHDQILRLGGQAEQISIATEVDILKPREAAKLVAKHEAHLQWRTRYVAENFQKAKCIEDNRLAHLKYACAAAQTTGLALEFGVFKGESITLIQQELKQTVFGFDTFTGLPGNWTKFHPKTFFDLEGKTPDTGQNIHYVKGLFQDTLDIFLQKQAGSIRLIHMDADLYESTSFVLDRLRNRLQVGSVIIFDDFFYSHDYERCDYRACEDSLKKQGVELTCLAYQPGGSASFMVETTA